jgi:L-arabinokinase
LTLVCYISGHGFGHASRCIELLNTLADKEPGLRIVVRSQASSWLIRHTARPAIELDTVECDTGVVQIDSLRLDEEETVRRAARFMETLPARAAAEAAELESLGATLVLADIPALGIAAGRRAGRPAVALGNFSWDWAYSAYDGGGPVADAIGRVYAEASLALRLPLWGGFGAFPRVCDLPFIARRSKRDPFETRAAFGLHLDEPVALVSFGGYGAEGLDLDGVSHIEGYRVVMSSRTPLAGRGPGSPSAGALVWLDESAMYARGYRYEDLVRASDVVVTKPGYGIISECAANDTAILYTSRGHFIEYDVLVAGMGRYVRAAYIDHDDLFAGRWTAHLDRLLAQPPPPERARVDGAEVAADLLLRMLNEGTV